jgi:HEAT repeat protein
MRSVGAERLFPYLREALNDPDPEFRCRAALAVFYVDTRAGFDLILLLLDDPDSTVRWQACGLLHDMADARAAPRLIEVMQGDPDPQVRGTAAYALGGIGDPSAIPALLQTLEHDHECDELGYTASGSAATALDDILKTQHTRIKFPGGLCTLPGAKLDLALLKTQAMEFYRQQQSH